MKKDRCIKELYNFQGMSDEVFCTNEYGFVVDSFNNFPREKTINLKQEWYDLIGMCETKNKDIKKSKTARKLVYKGIPLSLKYKLWGIFVEKTANFDYQELIKKKSGYEHQIHVDVQRTFRRHFLFSREYGRGQCELFNILAAYSNYNPTIGYCQGMSSIAAILLMYFPEKEAFEMLVNIIKNNHLETLFDTKLSKIPKIQIAQEEIFKITVPEVYGHLISQKIDISVYAVGWYLTLFTRFDIKFVLRMWDLFLFLDFSVFLYLAAAILNFFASKILELKGEKLIEFIGTLDSEHIEVEKVISYFISFVKKVDYDLYKRKIY